MQGETLEEPEAAFIDWPQEEEEEDDDDFIETAESKKKDTALIEQFAATAKILKTTY
jgi:hypothetical protein